MKLFLLTVLIAFMVVTNASCTDNGESAVDYTKPINNIENASGNTTDAENSDTTTESEDVNDNIKKETVTVHSQEEMYKKFQESVDSNYYDKWLEEELSECSRSEKEIYAEYLNFWKTELLLTIDAGQYLFDDQEAYKEWKNCLEEWLSSTTEALRVEVNLLLGTIPQLDSIIPCCKLVRQKAIDTKFFLYQLDWQKSEYTPSIIWTVTAKSYEN